MASTIPSSARLLSPLFRLSLGAEAACMRNYSLHSPNSFSSKSTLRLISTTCPHFNQASTNSNLATDVNEAETGDVKPELRSSQSPVSISSEGINAQTDNTKLLTVKRSQQPKEKSLNSKRNILKEERHKGIVELSAALPPQRPKGDWQVQKEALKKKFGDQGWSPRKKLSPDTMEGIRVLHEQYPDKYTTPVLAQQFEVSPEAIRRILKSKWRPSPEKMEERRQRWAKRHDRIWDAQAEIGLRPKRKKGRLPEGPEKLDDIIPLMPNVVI